MLQTINGFDVLLIMLIAALSFVISLQRHTLKTQERELIQWDAWYENTKDIYEQ